MDLNKQQQTTNLVLGLAFHTALWLMIIFIGDVVWIKIILGLAESLFMSQQFGQVPAGKKVVLESLFDGYVDIIIDSGLYFSFWPIYKVKTENTATKQEIETVNDVAITCKDGVTIYGKLKVYQKIVNFYQVLATYEKGLDQGVEKNYRAIEKLLFKIGKKFTSLEMIQDTIKNDAGGDSSVEDYLGKLLDDGGVWDNSDGLDTIMVDVGKLSFDKKTEEEANSTAAKLITAKNRREVADIDAATLAAAIRAIKAAVPGISDKDALRSAQITTNQFTDEKLETKDVNVNVNGIDFDKLAEIAKGIGPFVEKLKK